MMNKQFWVVFLREEKALFGARVFKNAFDCFSEKEEIIWGLFLLEKNGYFLGSEVKSNS